MDIDFKEVNIEKLGQEDKSQQKAIVGFVFAIIIYFFIFMYGVQVMRGVIEEKTNRIVEVIISSVKPFQLMMGKVVRAHRIGRTYAICHVDSPFAACFNPCTRSYEFRFPATNVVEQGSRFYYPRTIDCRARSFLWKYGSKCFR